MFIHSSIYDPVNIISQIKDLSIENTIDGVMCLGTDAPVTVATIANEFNLSSVPITAAKKTSNKAMIKEVFYEVGINTPSYLSTKEKEEARTFTNSNSFPMIIKPDDSRGSRGVGILWDASNFDLLFEEAQNFSSSGTVIIEEYIDGQQISTESIIYDNRSYTPGFSDRNYELITRQKSRVIENGGDLPAKLDDETKEKINKLVEKLALALEIKNGVIKGDVILCKGQIYFIEVALRLSGGYFSSHKIPYSTGVNMLDAATKICTGEELDIKMLEARQAKPVSQRFLFPQEGKIQSINNNYLDSKKDILFSNISIPASGVTKSPENHTSRLGCVIATGKDRQDAINNAEKFISNIDLVYVK